MARSPDLLIIGGGLAGLAAARVAEARGVDWRLIEASDRLGGRVASDTVEGFTIDRGFQILLTSYPELVRLGVLDALDLRRFEPGSEVRTASPKGARFHRATDPWRRPMQAFDLGWRHVFGLRDGLTLASFRASIGSDDPDAANRSTFEYLKFRGFSDEVMARFFVPFLGGVLLDRTLSVPATFMRRLFRAFSRGDAVLPARGMGALPEAIARPLPRARVTLGVAVTHLDASRCELASGQTLEPSKVILATDGDSAAALVRDVADLGDLAAALAPRAAGWQRTTSCFYATRGPLPAPLDRPYLVLNGGDGALHHLAPLSTVAPEYAPRGEHLVVASHDGAADPTLEPALRRELTAWFPSAEWRLVAVRPVARALPVMAEEPTATFLRPKPWLAVAGDHVGDRSIDGALASGRQAAEALLA